MASPLENSDSDSDSDEHQEQSMTFSGEIVFLVHLPEPEPEPEPVIYDHLDSLLIRGLHIFSLLNRLQSLNSSQEILPTVSEKRGLSQESKEKLKPYTVGKEITCPICLDDCNVGDQCIELPKCNHVYHSTCIFEWFKEARTCPTCRIDLDKNT